jgi:hypothetical protein
MNRLLTIAKRRPSRRTHLVVEQLECRWVPSITFHGGPLLTHVEVEPIYYGSYWTAGAGAQQASDLNTFLQFITGSSYMDMLSEYNVGRGTLVDNGVADPGIAGAHSIDDSQLRSAITVNVNRGSVQAPDHNRLYIVFTAPNMVVTSGSETSSRDFFGYHDSFVDSSFRVIRYAIIAHPVGNGDAPGLNDFQTLTWTASHELAESVTNPDNGGWFDTKTNDEIADLCDSVDDAGVLNGYVVSAVWSVQQNSCVIPADAQPFTSMSDGGPSFALREQVADAFTGGAEYSLGVIERDYQMLLGRMPSTGETGGWLAAVQSGMTDEQVLASFAGSSEYYQRAGGTDRLWIDALYHDLLGRTPSASEENGWLSVLAAGTSRGDIAYGFATSPEHEVQVVALDYQTYLGRSGLPAEVANWSAALEQGTLTNEQIIAVFVSSSEFYFGQGGTVESWITGLYRTVLGRAPDKGGFAAWDAFVLSATG